ncbi:hypothetical protein M3Y98_00179800 [Aphelenchoides besseyi]|nr:hypothetical protein M3Y98_00179800 [Aphelenchoides besseyi]KAI6200095.1 hypothetical protein M3Y96_00696800 [Aphelenchoides besseyi]
MRSWKDWTILLPILISASEYEHQQKATTTFDVQKRLVGRSASTTNELEEYMWPNPQTYKPISWDHYFTQTHEKQVSLTSGLAAGITLGLFFAVFVLVFGCRRAENLRRLSTRPQQTRTLSQRRLSVSDFFTCSDVPIEPPPSYEVAIRMPQPPAFTDHPDFSVQRHNGVFPA